MISVNTLEAKSIKLVTAATALCMLFACGQHEDYYLEPQTSLKSGDTPENASILSQINEAQRDSQSAFSNALAAAPATALNGLPIGALGTTPFIAAGEIIPEAPTPVDELPQPDLWAPDEDNEEGIPDFTEVPEADDDVRMPNPVNVTSLAPLEELTDHQFGQVCKAIELLYEAQDAEALSEGECAFDYATGQFNSTDIEILACDRQVDECSRNADDSQDAQIPIGLCKGEQVAPESCAVNFAQVQTCLTAHQNSQLALSEINVCDIDIDNLTATRSLINDHRQAVKCLQKLESHCPAIAFSEVD